MKRPEKSMRHLSDAFLAAEAQLGDDRAAEELVRRYGPELHGYLVPRFFIAGAEPDDVFAECLYGLLTAIRDFDPAGGSSFRSFAHLCATRKVQDAVKAQLRGRAQIHHSAQRFERPTDRDLEEGSNTLHDVTADTGILGRDPADMAGRVNPLRLVEDAAEEDLTAREAAAVIGLAAGESYEEIAVRIHPDGGINEKSVDNALQRARRKLKERFADAA